LKSKQGNYAYIGKPDLAVDKLPTAQINTGDNSVDNKDKQTISPAKPSRLSGKDTNRLFQISITG